jgi:acylaminoacyl-peptidase
MANIITLAAELSYTQVFPENLFFISIFMSISGSSKPYEAIFVSSKTKKSDTCDPLIVVLHGGPHSVSLSSFSKSHAFLSSLGYSLLIVNYR